MQVENIIQNIRNHNSICFLIPLLHLFSQNRTYCKIILCTPQNKKNHTLWNNIKVNHFSVPFRGMQLKVIKHVHTQKRNKSKLYSLLSSDLVDIRTVQTVWPIEAVFSESLMLFSD